MPAISLTLPFCFRRYDVLHYDDCPEIARVTELHELRALRGKTKVIAVVNSHKFNREDWLDEAESVGFDLIMFDEVG